MKSFLCTLFLFALTFTSLQAQSMLRESLDNHRHGIVLSTNITLVGSTIHFRPGLSIGYTYFGDKFNFKALTEYSSWSVPNTLFIKSEFRFNFKYEYEHYVNDWFSLAVFMTPEFRYNEDFYPNNDPRNNSEVTYAVGFGLSPKIYQMTDKFYYSLGFDLPFLETGYFQGEGPDPSADDVTIFTEGFRTKVFASELRAVASFGYRF